MTDLFQGVLPIKTISLWQPWASLVAKGLKRHETRHWPTSHRGPIAIHAAKTLDVAGAPDDLLLSAFGYDWMSKLPLGAIVAVAELTACHSAPQIRDQLTRADVTAGNYAQGRFAWELSNIQPLAEPIPLSGRQGLFNWSPPEDLRRRLGAPVDHAAACTRIGWR